MTSTSHVIDKGWQLIGTVLLYLLPLLLVGCVSQSKTDAAMTLAPVEVTATRRTLPEHLTHRLARPADLWGAMAHDLSWEESHPAIDRERLAWLEQPLLQETLSARAPLLLEWIVAEIRRRELPMELALVPIVESMLDPWAYSSQRAAGLWQITPATAAYFGLEVNWWYDGRLDLLVATDFALGYLEELHAEFNGDWLLALAAYNGGKGRITRALENTRQINANDLSPFWWLELPRETARYVPKIIALSQLLRDAAAFEAPWPLVMPTEKLVVTNTEGQMDLAKVTELTGLSLGALRQMNSALLRWSTPPEGPYHLLLPEHLVPDFENAVQLLDTRDKISWHRYQIAPGDSLGAIANRFNTEVQVLQVTNGLEGTFIRAGDTLLIPGVSAGNLTSSDRASIDWPPQRRPKRYTVRRGDSLWSIARRYDLRVQELASMNSVDPAGYIRPGQTLRLTP